MALEGMGSGGGTFGKGSMTLTPKKVPYKSAVNVASVEAPTKIPGPTQIDRTGTQSPTSPISSFDGGAFDSGAASAPAPQLSDQDFLAGDSNYQAQLAALLKALSDQQADSTAQQSKYNVDYGSALQNLGWSPDDPATADVNEGAWNFGDQNTAAGRAFQNQQNDFAGRGLLQSSLYGTANDNLTRSLNDQLGGINTAKQNFFDDLTRQGSAFAGENTLAQQQAKAEALARRAAGVSL